MLSNEKEIKRKIQELYLSYQLEKYFTKEQILEIYLNNVLFGNKIYGIKRASEYYFNKNPNELSVSESALLAGIIQLPNYYNPYKNLEESIQRRNIVLKKMYENNYIDYDQYNYFKEEEIILNNGYDNKISSSNKYAQYIDYVFKELDSLNLDINTSIEVYTNLNTKIQTEIFKILNNDYKIFPDDKLNSGIVYIDSKTGNLEALGGSRKNNFQDLNYATDVYLQPGSTIKPLLVYAPYIEYNNISPSNIILDEEYKYKTGQIIRNWDYLYKGNITLRKSLVESRNVPAVKIYNKFENKENYKFINSLNLYTDEYLEAHSLGGFTKGFTVLEMTNAYQSFSNKGNFIKANAIRKIITDNKEIIISNNEKKVMKESTSYIISDILKDVSTYSNLNIKNMVLMTKTGQTNYDLNSIDKYNIPNNSTKDSWVIGYSKEKTLGIWTGYDIISENTYLTSKTKDIPKDIFKKIMLESNYYDNTFYDFPSNLIKIDIEIDDDRVYLKDPLNNNSYYKEIFFKGTEPTTYKGKKII